MEDRELLEAAAKAADIPVHEWYESGASILPIEGWPGKSWWNPLTDDGDALRLLASIPSLWSLNMVFGGPTVEVRVACGLGAGIHAAEHAGQGADRPAAIRRAIVRAAAAMCPREPHNVEAERLP